MTAELLVLFFFFFFEIVLVNMALLDNIILSFYFSFLFMTLIANLLSRKEIVFSSSIAVKIILFSLIFSAGVAFYYSFVFTFSTFYVVLIPFLCLFSILYFPLLFLLKKKIYEGFARKSLIFEGTLLSLLITLIPIIISLEISRLEFLVNTLLVINYSLLIFPSISLLFVGINYYVGVLSKRRSLVLSYYLVWIFIIDIVLAIFLISQANLVIISLNLLLLSVGSHFNLKYGLKLEKVKDSAIIQFVRINSYIMTLELSFLFFFLFYSYVLSHLVFYLNFVFSLYISLLLMVFIVNLLSQKEIVFSGSITVKINVIALIYTAGLAFFYSLLYTFNSMYVFLVPFLCLVSILFFPTYYLYKIDIYKKVTRKLIIVEGIILAACIALIPIIISSELFLSLGLEIDRVSILNYTLYITFGLLIITHFIFKKYKIKDVYKLEVVKSQIFLLVIFAGSTIFYYLFTIIPGTYYKFLFPLMAASIFLYIPSVISYKKRYFNESSLKKWIMANSLLLFGSIIFIPVVIGLEFALRGLGVDLILISWSTLLLFFVNLKYLVFISHRFKVLEQRIKVLKVIRILTWFLISLLVGFEIYFLLPTVLSPSSSIFITFMLNIYTLKLLSDYSKEKRYINIIREIITYGIIFSLAFQVVSLLRFSSILNLLPAVLLPLNLIWYLGSFFIIVFLFIKLLNSFSKFSFSRIKNSIELISWFSVKISVSVLVSMFFQFSILTMGAIFFLMFALLSPVTITSLVSLKISSERGHIILKRIILSIWLISLMVLYIDTFYFISQLGSLFDAFGILYISIIFSNCFLLVYYSIIRYNLIIRSESTNSVYQFYIGSLILCISLLFVNFFPLYLAFLFIFSSYLILSRRSIFVVFKFLAYFFLSYAVFSAIALSLPNYGIFSLSMLAYHSQLYLVALTIVLLLAIWMHKKRNNNLEKYSLYSILSFLSFLILSMYTNILLLYNITIALSLFTFFMGIYFYRKKNEVYKWFIRPCALLLIFDFVSFISYSLLFNNPQYVNYSPILTLTFTLSLTGFGFVGLYNRAPANFRKKSFYFVLISIIISFPIFLYFLIIASIPALIGDIIPLIIAINVGVILFYLSIGIYQWRISWAIWKSGWYAWIALPIVNFLIIYRSVRNIDVFTNSLTLFGTITIDGSIILTSIICVIFSLPFWYTWLKKHFYHSLFIVWGLSLFLIYWTSQNIFAGSQLLVNSSFLFLAVVFLIPLLIKLKLWKLTSVIWLTLIVFNFSFLLFYLPSLGMSLGMAISFDILAVGVLLMIYSFFPNIRSIGVILIIAYSTILFGVFLSIYFVLLAIILEPIFSLNLSFLVLGFSLFSSKYFKLPSRFVNLILSWILIFNFAWLTFNTFSLFPGMDLFPFFLALTVFGCSFFIFNRYKMKFRINRMIPLFLVAVGTSLSVSSLVSILLHVSPYILICISSAIFIVFLYFIFIDYRYFLWVFIPIPMVLPILDQILLIKTISSSWMLGFLSFSILYVLFFQVLINIFKKSGKKESEEPTNSLWKIFQDNNQVRLLNFTSFLLNSVFISLYLAILIPIMLNNIIFGEILIIYQTLDFLIIWPTSLLFCFKYIEKSELTLKVKNQLLHFKKISFLLYLLIPFASSMNLFLYTMFVNINLAFAIYASLLMLSGIAFFEGIVVDREIFRYLTTSLRNKLIFWSWFIFGNTLSFFLYTFHKDIFLLMCSISSLHLISLYFLSNFNISKRKIFTTRIILLYNLFIWGSFYVGSMISRGIILLFKQLSGIPPYLLLFQNTVLILYFLSYFFVKFNKKAHVELILFAVFQVLFAINLLYTFNIYNILTVFTIILTILFETILLFKTVHYINKISFEARAPQFLPKIFSLLITGLYLELSLLIYGVMIEFTGIFESILVSQIVFLLLTLLDIYAIKKIKRSYAFLIHTFSFLIISVTILLMLHQFVSLFQFLLYIELLVFFLMQFYTSYSLFKTMNNFSPSRVESFTKWRKGINRSLGIAFYVTLFPLLFEVLLSIGVEIQLILLSLSIMAYVLMVFDTNGVKLLGKVSNYLKLMSWISVMTFTASYLVSVFARVHLFNIFAIALIALLETFLLFQLVKYLNGFFFQEKHPQFLKNSFSILVIILYFEISLLMYGLTAQFAGIFESILVSQVILLILTLLDIYSIKKIKRGYGQLIHTISYFVITCMLFLIIHNLVVQVPILLSVNFAILILLQFYTNYSFFATLNQFNPDKKEINQKHSSQMKRVLGTGFYITICFILYQSLILLGLAPQLIFISVSLLVHILMIIDSHILKFLGKGANYLKVGTWGLIMVSTGALLIYVINLFSIINFFTLSFIIILETSLLFQFVKYLYFSFLKEKHPQFLKKTFSLLVIILYFEISLLMYGLMAQFTGIFESILVSQVTLFILTILDIYSVKKIKKGYAQLIHTISYFMISLMILLLLHSAIGKFQILLSVEILLFVSMQFYTNYSFFATLKQFYPNKNEIIQKRSSQMKRILGTGFYSTLCFILLQPLILFGVAPQLIFLILSLMIHCIMIFDSRVFKFLGSAANYLKVGTWSLIMVSAGVFILYILGLFSLFNFFTLASIIISETSLLFQFVKYLNNLFLKEKHPQFLSKTYSLLVIAIYLELSLLMYGLVAQFASIIVSILVSQVVLFALIVVDIYSIKKIKKGYAQLIHTISYFMISLMILLLLHGSVAQFPILLSLEFTILIIMQFYTNYSFFAAMDLLHPDKKEIIVKRKSILTRALGASLYILLSLCLLQSLIMVGTAPQLIFLSLSLMGHVLMLLDSYILKFLGKYAHYLKVVTWIFLMAFTTSYLIWFYIAYFISFFSTSIPLIIFILILEAAYLAKLLDFSSSVLANKQKIRSFLLFMLYLDFITWPLYFITLNPLRSLNLVIFSFLILLVFTYIDEKVRVFPEKRLVPLRKATFLMIGGLLSIDFFVLLGFAPNTTLLLNLSVALLNFVIFLGIIVKPFKGNSLKAFAFWMSICLLSSFIIREFSNSYTFWAIFVITLLIYPFVFLLEELRELFNKLVDLIIVFFKKMKIFFVNVSKAIFSFIKANFKIIWILFSIFLAIFIGISMSKLVLDLLNWGHTTLLMLAIVGLLTLVIPSEESEDPDVIFKRRVLRLSIGWGSVISLLFILITPDWYLFTGFVSTAVVGTIILVIIRRKEESQKISIKWRFYTLLSLFILLIILGVLSLLFFIGNSP
jgi:hypothetical protein